MNGIGPKGGQAVLSVLSPDDLRFAVLSGDVKAICAAPGIGKKTAEKVILELKDKLSLEDALEHTMTGDAGDISCGDPSGVQSEAVQALTALGYSSTCLLYTSFKNLLSRFDVQPEAPSIEETFCAIETKKEAETYLKKLEEAKVVGAAVYLSLIHILCWMSFARTVSGIWKRTRSGCASTDRWRRSMSKDILRSKVRKMCWIRCVTCWKMPENGCTYPVHVTICSYL